MFLVRKNVYRCLSCARSCERALCDACFQTLQFLDRRCKTCGREVVDRLFCGDCLQQPKAYSELHVVSAYHQVARTLVLKAKFAAHPLALDIMGELMAKRLAFLRYHAKAIIPMPIAKMRLAKRGFNQTHYLGQHCAKAWGIPLLKNALRKENRAAQSAMEHESDRYRNIKGSMSVGNYVLPKRVFLLDDVLTTGASMHEAAKTLKRAGVQEVIALAFALVDIS